MKTLFRLLAFLVLAPFAFSQTANVTKTPGTDAIKEDLVIGAGRTLTLSGNTTGTPTGGTLSLANLTLTLPSSFTWAGTLAVANGGTGVTTSTGTGSVVRATSPTLVTPTIDTITASASTALTLTGGSTGASLVLGQGTSGGTTSTAGSVATGYANKIFRVLNGAGTAHLTATGDGRVYVGPDVATNSFLSVRRSTGNSVTEMLSLNDADALTTQFYYPNSTTFSTRILGSVGSFQWGNSGVGSSQLNLNTATGNLLIGTTTDMTGSGGLKIAGTTPATTTTSGALIVAGGVGVSGSIYAGQNIFATGVINTSGTVGIPTTGNLQMGGSAANGGVFIGLGSTNDLLWANGAGSTVMRVPTGTTTLQLNGTTSASSSTVGALTIGNGTAATNVAIGGGNVNAGGTGIFRSGMTIGSGGGASTTLSFGGNSSIADNGSGGMIITTSAGQDMSIVLGGNFDWQKPNGSSWNWRLNSAGGFANRMLLSDTALTIYPTTPSTGPTSGALQVAGGVGVSGAGYFGGAINAVGGQVTGTFTVGNGTANATNAINRGTTAQGNYVQWQTAGTSNWAAGSGATGTNTNWELYNYGIGANALSISNTTSAATFAGAVTAGGTLTVNNALANFGNGTAGIEVRASGDGSTTPYGYWWRSGGTYEASMQHQASTGVLTLDAGRNAAWGAAVHIAVDTTRSVRFAKNLTTFDQPATFAGAVSIASTTPSTGSTSGALQVAGGIYAGAASVFGAGIGLFGATPSSGLFGLSIGAMSGTNQYGITDQNGSHTVTAPATEVMGHRVYSTLALGASGTLTNWYGFNSTLNSKTGAAALTNAYAFYANSPTQATNNYAFYSAGTAPSVFGGTVTAGGGVTSGALGTFRSAGAATTAANTKAASAVVITDNQTANTDSALAFGINGTTAYIQSLYTTVTSALAINPYGGAVNFGTGAATFAGAVTANGQLIAKGTATNDNAATGYIGEYVENSTANTSGTAVSLTTNTVANVSSISLTAGDWDVSCMTYFVIAGGSATAIAAGITQTSATFGGTGSYAGFTGTIAQTTFADNTQSVPVFRVKLTGTTTVYLVARSTFPGTCSTYGMISARRVR